MTNQYEWFDVEVEDKATGIRAIHSVQATSPSNARDEEEEKGFLVLSVMCHGVNTHWPKLPNYQGRPLY